MLDLVDSPPLNITADTGVNIKPNPLSSVPHNPTLPSYQISIIQADPLVQHTSLDTLPTLEVQLPKIFKKFNPESSPDDEESFFPLASPQQLNFNSTCPFLFSSQVRDDCHLKSIYGASNKGTQSDSRVPIVPLESRETILHNFRQFQLKLRSLKPSKPPDTTIPLTVSLNDSSLVPAPLQPPVMEIVPSSELIFPASIFAASDFLETHSDSQQPFQQVTRRRGRTRKQSHASLVFTSTQNPQPPVCSRRLRKFCRCHKLSILVIIEPFISPGQVSKI